MTSQLDTVIDCANIAMNCDHTADPVGMVCWTCAMKMVSIAEAAEADNAGLRGMLRDEIMRAEAAEAKRDEQFETNVKLLQENIELKAERDAFAGENEAIHRAVNELCGTDTSTIEAVQHVINERDEARRQLERAVSDEREACAKVAGQAVMRIKTGTQQARDMTLAEFRTVCASAAEGAIRARSNDPH